MSGQKMHIDEVDTDAALVGRLLATQFPQWAALSIEPVASAGTDNALYRLGDKMVVRLPRVHSASAQVDKEQHWLPRLAPYLPLAIPIPLAKGEPGEQYPYHWSVYSWLEGEKASAHQIADPRQAAIDLAQFIRALEQIDTTGGPPPGVHNFFRGEPLAMRDEATRASIASLRELFPVKTLTAVWDAAITAPVWQAPPVWLHGDLHSENLLAVQGRLCAVIDFGGLGVGDPACDVMTAWLYLPEDTRGVFCSTLGVDDATWMRARGWALTFSLAALPYYWVTNPVLADISRHAIDEILADYYADGGMYS
ncbi:MAG: aminoglycoside phosphotransferase family protein [Anaerolineae bacterium]